MNFALGGPLLFFFIFILVSGMHGSCPSGWHHYKDESVCIKVFEYNRVFSSSKQFCRHIGAELVQVSDKNKELFLKEIRTAHGSSYLIGMADLDSDMKYEFLNGSEVDTSLWPALLKKRQTHKHWLCTGLALLEYGINAHSCYSPERFFCEVAARDSTEIKTFGEPCRLNNCTCKREDWIAMDGGEKFIKINLAANDFATSRKTCESFGGRLFVARLEGSQNILTDIIKSTNENQIFWIGLTKSGQEWLWFDGHVVIPHIKLTPIPGEDGGLCGAIQLSKKTRVWKEVSCSSTRYSVCETKKPCVPSVVMTVNNTIYLHNKSITMMQEQDVKFECSTSGLSHLVKSVIIDCGKGKVRSTKWKLRIHIFGHIGKDVNRMQCTCDMDLYDETHVDQLAVVVVYKSYYRTCPPTWHLYEDDDHCIREYHYYRTFYSSQEFCRLVGADLVQISTKKKQFFLTQMRHLPNTRFQLGLTDLDNDMTYELRNGTKVDISIWPKLQESRRSHKDQLCTQLAFYTLGIRAADCYSEIKFLCEVASSKAAALRKFGERCEIDNCICRKEDWVQIRKGGKFVKINLATNDFETSREICEGLGGDLLMPKVESTLVFLQDILPWRNGSQFFWLGVIKVRNNWIWIDGEKRKRNVAVYRIPGTSDGSCGGYQKHGKAHYWGRTNCYSSHYSICETTNPCATDLVMTVNNTRIDKDKNITFNDRQTVVIKCSTRGYPQLIQALILKCRKDNSTNNMVRSERWEPDVYMSIHVDDKVNEMQCSCHILFYDKTQVEPITVGLVLKTRPRFVNEQDATSPIFTIMGKGRDLIIDFEIYANPEPETCNLTNVEHVTSLGSFNVSIEPQGETIRYWVTITVLDTDNIAVGMYTLIIQNKIKGKLEYAFFIQRRSDIKELLTSEQGTNHELWVIYAIGSLCLVAIALVFAYTSEDLEVIDMEDSEGPQYDDDVSTRTSQPVQHDEHERNRRTANVDDGLFEYEKVSSSRNDRRMTNVDDGHLEYERVSPSRNDRRMTNIDDGHFEYDKEESVEEVSELTDDDTDESL